MKMMGMVRRVGFNGVAILSLSPFQKGRQAKGVIKAIAAEENNMDRNICFMCDQ